MDENEKTGNDDAGSGQEAYQQAVALLHQCHTKDGFVATPTEKDNYHRIWSRDSAVMGLAALLSGDDELIAACRDSLETLAARQGPHGEIPSNVDPLTDRVSYGGTAGRVDGNLWFVICCAEYWHHTKDQKFLERMLEPLEKIRFLLGAWEFNNRGLLYIPPTGDWADEYLQSGYVLYDQILYYQALAMYGGIHRHVHGSTDHVLEERRARLKHLIRANYWFSDGDKVPDDVYHEILFKNGKRAAPRRSGSYWMPFFSPLGYGYRFDGMANALTMMMDIADEDQSAAVDDYISRSIVNEKAMMLPAFSPVITAKDEDWEDLQMTFSYTFKNQPHEFHNGGLWPLVSAFYACGLAMRGKEQLAGRYCQGIDRANRSEMNGKPWGFPEYLHGEKLTPGGTSPMGWSAAATIIAREYLNGKRLFTGLSGASA